MALATSPYSQRDGVAATSVDAIGEYWVGSHHGRWHVAHWPRPASFLEAGSVRLSISWPTCSREDSLAWWLAHPDVTVTGLDSAGARAGDRDIFGERFTIDHGDNSFYS